MLIREMLKNPAELPFKIYRSGNRDIFISDLFFSDRYGFWINATFDGP